MGRGWEEGPVRKRERWLHREARRLQQAPWGVSAPGAGRSALLRVGCPGSWLAGQELSRPPGLALG